MPPKKYALFPNGECYTTDRGLFSDDIAAGRATELSGEKGEEAFRACLRARLLKFIRPGSGILVVNVAGTGKNPAHRVFAWNGNAIECITRDVAELCGFRLREIGGWHAITQGGGGYSKSFQIVYDLGRALWPNGTPEPHGARNGRPDSDGGYALMLSPA